jgi:hypothetical protein
MSKKILSALLVGTVLTISTAAHATSTSVFTGVDVAHNSWFAYVGGVTALQGQDITTQAGFLARLAGGYGQYHYNRPFTTSVDGDVGDGNLMVGYGSPFSGGHIAGYIGGDWTDHHLSPNDTLNKTRGTRGGAMGQLELNFSPADHFNGNVLGSYSTAFNTYWSRADVGYNFGSVTVGPEIGFSGDKSYDEIRYGAHLSAIDLGFATAGLHGGWVNSNRRGGDGGYGDVGFSRRF